MTFLLRTSRSIALRRSQICKPVQPLVIAARNAYEAPMSSYLTIINQKDPTRRGANLVASYSTLGFRLINDSFIYGPMLIFEDYVFCWNIKGDDEINEESLQFMFHVHPPLDLIIIGYSHPENKDIHRRNLHLIARKYNCAVEVLPVEKAIGTYNFLLETRNVAGAFVPPSYVLSGRSDYVRQYFNTPDTLDLPLPDSEKYYDMIDMPRYRRVEKKVLASNKKDSKQIESTSKETEIQVNKEDDKKPK